MMRGPWKRQWHRIAHASRDCVCAIIPLPPGEPFLIRFVASQRLMWFNDDSRTSHEDVMALFDRTISHLATTARISVPA